MIPDLTTGGKKVLYDYLDKSKYYFEYGLGGSTFQAFKRKNIKKIYTVESDKKWIDKLYKTSIPKDDDRLKIIYVDFKLDIKPKIKFGYPGKKSTYNDWIKYTRAFSKLSEDQRKKIDTILIDGRFRVACALNLYSKIFDNTTILFDDFFNRKYYHVILKYYDIVKKVDNRMAVLKKKPNIKAPSKELLFQYENDAR